MKARDLATGKWRDVLTSLGVPSDALDGKHHRCPKDDSGTDRFRFTDRNGSGAYFCACSDGTKGGMALLMCCRGLSYADAAKEVERVVEHAVASPVRTPKDPRIALNRVRSLAVAGGFAVARYLRERGLKMAPGLKQARLTYWHDGKKLGVFEAMLGIVVSPSGQPLTYHVTYLDGAKKADVPNPRKVMTPVETITGGAIRLYPMAPRLGIAEGIETAIAAHMLHGLPVWAVVSAGGMEGFQPPAGVDRLVIFGDTDESYTGQSAAYLLAKRLTRAGTHCDVRLPDAGDWNDTLLRKSHA